MAYLLDTVVISELRRKERSSAVESWFHTLGTDEAFLSVITIGEIENGIVRKERVNPGFAMDLTLWLDSVLQHYSEQILLFTIPIARRWGRLCAEHGRADADMMIAATALEHGLVVATRNVKHFEPTGVRTINPWQTT